MRKIQAELIFGELRPYQLNNSSIKKGVLEPQPAEPAEPADPR